MKSYPICKGEDTKNTHSLQAQSSNLDINFFFKDSSLSIEDYKTKEDGSIILYARSSCKEGYCPYCQARSERIHSRYIRHLHDLPILGRNVTICFQARKFFCINAGCRYRTFAEQPGNEVFRYRRRTRRCEVLVYRHGMCLSSINTSMLLGNMGIQLSKSTILRDLHKIQVPQQDQVKSIGVDDWAFRKGVEYGTIIIDLTKGIPIDLLGTRNEDDFSKWLRKHENVRLVSRDRSTEYSHAIAASEVPMTEVADRFHLIKNMGDCITDAISSRYKETVSRLKGPDIKDGGDGEKAGKRKERYVNEVKFNEVKRLQMEGKGISETANLLGIARQTVRKYRDLYTFPYPKGKPRHAYHIHKEYVEEQYARGVSLDAIRKDLRTKGFIVSRTPFLDHFSYLSDGHRGYRSAEQRQEMEKRWLESPKTENTVVLPPVGQLAILINKSVLGKNLTAQECEVLNSLFGIDWFDELHEAATSFRKCLGSGKPSRLDKWLKKYENSIVPRIRTFVKGIKLDLKAVKNSIIYPVSNGITEG